MAPNVDEEDDWPTTLVPDLSFFDLYELGKQNTCILLKILKLFTVFNDWWTGLVSLDDLISDPPAIQRAYGAVMDSIERDNTNVHNTSVREDSKQLPNIDHEEVDIADSKMDEVDEGGLFGSGSENEEDAQ